MPIIYCICTKKSQLLQIRNNTNNALRKTKNNEFITVNEILNNEEFTQNLIKNDEGYNFLKEITGYPVYFEI